MFWPSSSLVDFIFQNFRILVSRSQIVLIFTLLILISLKLNILWYTFIFIIFLRRPNYPQLEMAKSHGFLCCGIDEAISRLETKLSHGSSFIKSLKREFSLKSHDNSQPHIPEFCQQKVPEPKVKQPRQIAGKFHSLFSPYLNFCNFIVWHREDTRGLKGTNWNVSKKIRTNLLRK